MASVDIFYRENDRAISKELRHLLQDILTPLPLAKSGDMIAMVANASSRGETVNLHSFAQYLFKTDEYSDPVRYEELTPEQQASVAHASMMINGKYLGHLAHYIETTMNQLSAGDGEYFSADLLLMADTIVLISDEADDYLENVIADTTEVDKFTGDRLVQVIKSPPSSNHAALKAQQYNAVLEDYLNGILSFEINDENGDLVPLKLNLIPK
jgi:hypothetical protein